MKTIIFYLIILLISFFINKFIYRSQVKKEIKNNIDLFVKRHESLVIKEINNELFKEDKEILNEEN